MKKELINLIQELLKKGYNNKEIAEKLGTYRQRIEYYKRTYPLADLQRKSKGASVKI